jgi:hypothetical protein
VLTAVSYLKGKGADMMRLSRSARNSIALVSAKMKLEKEEL